MVIFLVSQDHLLCLGVDRLFDGIRTRSLESHRRDGNRGDEASPGTARRSPPGLWWSNRDCTLAHRQRYNGQHNELSDNAHRSLAIAHQHRRRLECIRTPFASANHNLHIMAVMLAGGGGRFRCRSPLIETGDVTMRLALEVNFALWGMILCAAVQAAQQLEVF
jgi:hypothetical protein